MSNIEQIAVFADAILSSCVGGQRTVLQSGFAILSVRTRLRAGGRYVLHHSEEEATMLPVMTRSTTAPTASDELCITRLRLLAVNRV